MTLDVHAALEQGENFPHPGFRHDIEHAAFDVPSGEGRVLDFDRAARRGRSRRHVGMLGLDLFGPFGRNAEADGNVVGDVVAPDGQNARVHHCAVAKKDVIGRSATDVDDQSAELPLAMVEDGVRGGHRTHHNVVDLEVGLADAAQVVLDARLRTVHDMELGLEPAPDHAERTGHALLPVDVVALDDGVQEHIAGRNRDLEGALLDLVDVLVLDLVALLWNQDPPSLIQSIQMRPGHGSHDLGDFAIRLLFRRRDRVVEAERDLAEINNLALAHAARGRFARTDDAEESVAACLSDDRGDLCRSDLQSYMQ